MNKNLEIISYAVSLIVKAALLAARFTGRARKRSLKRLASMDIDAKDKEILFLNESIAVTERVIKTLKYEWLKRVPIIRGFDHLTMLCREFHCWYNTWRPHMTLDGLRPDDVYYDNKREKPKRDAKKVSCNIEQRFFQETRITGYRLRNAA